uniref:Uncharacterized protein n=1 Tax=Anguilla anguilla TaxID=7936 RepID=A0A0E9WDL7_ANGAN
MNSVTTLVPNELYSFTFSAKVGLWAPDTLTTKNNHGLREHYKQSKLKVFHCYYCTDLMFSEQALEYLII